MSELRHWYDRAAVSDRITQPPFAELADRGRRRARRTRTVRLAGVAVVAALAAAPLLTLPGEHEPGPAGALPPPAERTWDRHEIIVSFFDLDYGIAQYNDDACVDEWLSVTQDGGTTWSELRELPVTPYRYSGEDIGPEPVCVRPAVIPIASDTLVIPAPVPPSEPADQPSLISHDAGLTWQEYQPEVRMADSVPDGVSPSWPCDEQQCKEAGLGWHDPQTGDWMDLRNNPPGAEYDGLTVARDGSIWVSGPGADGDFHLAVSLDRGRSWLDRSPDEDIDWFPYAMLTVYDGDTAYLYPAYTAETDPFDLYRTTDGGETWQQMPAAQRFEGVVWAWTTPEGGLVVEEVTRDQYLSTDGGETFAPTELPVRWVSESPGGGLEGSPRDRSAADPVDLYLSEDGLTWRPVEVPYYPGPDEAPAATPSPGR
jgi:hypothetical protein